MLVYKNLGRDQLRAFIRVKAFLLFCGIATKCNGLFLPVNQTWFDLSYTQATFVPLLFFIASLFTAPIAGGINPSARLSDWDFDRPLLCRPQHFGNRLRPSRGELPSLFIRDFPHRSGG